MDYNLLDIPYPEPSQCLSSGVPDINKYPVLVTGMDQSTTLLTKVYILCFSLYIDRILFQPLAVIILYTSCFSINKRQNFIATTSCDCIKYIMQYVVERQLDLLGTSGFGGGSSDKVCLITRFHDLHYPDLQINDNFYSKSVKNVEHFK